MSKFRERAKGFKTVITGGFLVAYAAAAVLGIEVPVPEGEQALAFTGAVMILLRFVTDGPVGQK